MPGDITGCRKTGPDVEPDILFVQADRRAGHQLQMEAPAMIADESSIGMQEGIAAVFYRVTTNQPFSSPEKINTAIEHIAE